jgi:hypothetical protein
VVTLEVGEVYRQTPDEQVLNPVAGLPDGQVFDPGWEPDEQVVVPDEQVAESWPDAQVVVPDEQVAGFLPDEQLQVDASGKVVKGR